MPTYRKTTRAGANVIGQRHALKHMKKQGLVDEQILKPVIAAEFARASLETALLGTYKIGVRCGIKIALEALQSGFITLDPNSRDITAVNYPFTPVDLPKNLPRALANDQQADIKIPRWKVQLLPGGEVKLVTMKKKKSPFRMA